ncbi:hypothetical protein BpHYR1_023257 [Brachionus plicatilis]|uniref:Uncharacterized protein n=1 Tax=Brachionus plicatilis TaxID=10195 RepID=A0A3M7Q4C6_BRAPC|nr:hypothetical protein BpHYR1_023257 [Brachionus plicatilis]
MTPRDQSYDESDCTSVTSWVQHPTFGLFIVTVVNIIAPETINLGGIEIKVVKEISLLGFMIDHNLNFSKQACNMSLATLFLSTFVKLFKFKFEANNFNDTLFFHNSPGNLKNSLIKNDSRKLSYNLRNSANLIEPTAKTNSDINLSIRNQKNLSFTYLKHKFIKILELNISKFIPVKINRANVSRYDTLIW